MGSLYSPLHRPLQRTHRRAWFRDRRLQSGVNLLQRGPPGFLTVGRRRRVAPAISCTDHPSFVGRWGSCTGRRTCGEHGNDWLRTCPRLISGPHGRLVRVRYGLQSWDQKNGGWTDLSRAWAPCMTGHQTACARCPQTACHQPACARWHPPGSALRVARRAPFHAAADIRFGIHRAAPCCRPLIGPHS